MWNIKVIFLNYRTYILWVLIGIVAAALYFYGPIPQVAGYNHFANQSTWLGLPNAENVLTNLPFLLLGIWGVCRMRYYVIESKIERIAWMGFFIGLILTAFGSAYYHLEPNNFRLVWDRIPITLSFVCLFVAVLAERVSLRLAAISLLPMLLYSIAAVIYWYISETGGYGDLRFYIMVQLLPLLLIPFIIAMYAPRYTCGWMLLMVALWYSLAKIFEGLDGFIYDWSGYIISGHGIKHLLAAMACAQVIWMLEKRKIINRK